MPMNKNLLEFYLENGVREFLSDRPRSVAPVVAKVKVEFPSLASKSSLSRTVQMPESPPSNTSFSGISPANLNGIKTLEELKSIMVSFEGCNLKKTARNMVFGDGNPQTSIMFIGEAPGAEEDAQGLPFVGQSGQLLDQIMGSVGLNRKNAYIANIIPWRPPGNRPPTTEEISLCLPFIKKHIEIVNPKIIVLLGGVATKSLLEMNEGIMRLRGRIINYSTESGHEIRAIPTFHPAYLLRSPGQKSQVWKDMLLIKKLLADMK
jgi:uracil-DNA glycosylase family 4